MAEIYNEKSNTLISGTSGDDSIQNGGSWNNGWHNGGSKLVINALAGNDHISNYASNVTISGGEGNDTISNGDRFSFGSSTFINGDKGNDSIYSFGSFNTISGGAGDDTVYSFYSNVSISGGAGNDALISSGESRFITINGGAGNDYMEIFGNVFTITGGKGNDTLWNGCYYGSDGSIRNYDNYGAGLLLKYSSDDGNDKIYGFRADSTLSIGGGSYSTKKSGDNVIVTVGDGKISLMGAASLSKVNIVSDTLKVTNSTKSPVTVGSAIKTINASSRTKAVKITGNTLANTITGGSGKDTIYGGKGNDSILGGKGNDKLYGQSGNDVLRGGAGNDSLWGGAGNDSLWGGSGNDVFFYKAGEGTDKIFDYSSGDMLKILKSNGKSGGKFKSSKYSGGTLSLTISGGGQVIFDNVAKGDTFNINNTSYTISGSKLIRNS